MVEQAHPGFAAVLACTELEADTLLAVLPGPPGVVVQNAGGVLTPIAIRSLTEVCDQSGNWRVAVVLHTDCELLGLTTQFQRVRLEHRGHELSIRVPGDLALALGRMIRQRGIDPLDLIGVLYDDRHDPPQVVPLG